jgi:hypothetical protein
LSHSSKRIKFFCFCNFFRFIYLLIFFNCTWQKLHAINACIRWAYCPATETGTFKLSQKCLLIRSFLGVGAREGGGHKERGNAGKYGGCVLYPYMKIEE